MMFEISGSACFFIFLFDEDFEAFSSDIEEAGADDDIFERLVPFVAFAGFSETNVIGNSEVMAIALRQSSLCKRHASPFFWKCLSKWLSS
jgi:hypothetical protein